MLDIPYMVDHIPTHIARRAQARLAAAGIAAELLRSEQMGARCLRVDLEARPLADRLLDELMMLRYSEEELRAALNSELRKLCELYRQQAEIPASALEERLGAVQYAHARLGLRLQLESESAS